MITKISNSRPAQIVYHYDNGTVLSIVWGGGSYSQNHMNLKEFNPDATKEDSMYESNTFECMVLEGKAMEQWLIEEYGDNPAGYIKVDEMPRIISKANEFAKEEK